MNIHYLEIVTPAVEAMCLTYEAVYDVSFSEPVAELGQARTAYLPHGGTLGIRAPMSAEEEPVTRSYMLVDDIHTAAQACEDKGGQIIHAPLEIPGRGLFAICLTGGIQHGFWQL